MPLLRKLAMVLIAAGSLIGCASSAPVTVTKLVPVHPDVPADLLSCMPEPTAPVSVTEQSQVADYMVSLWQAQRDCRTRLNAVAGILDKAAAE